MLQTKLPFSFPVYYSVVFRDNSFLSSQCDIVNVLLFGHPFTGSNSGEATISDATSNHYALGRRAIADSHRLGVFDLPAGSVVERIRMCRLKNRHAAAVGIMALLRSGDLTITKERANKIIEWRQSEDEESFLALALISALECDFPCDKPLDKITIAYLKSFRERPDEPFAQPKDNNAGQAEPEPGTVEAREPLSDYDPSSAVRSVVEQHQAMDSLFEPAFQSGAESFPHSDVVPGHPEIAGAYYEIRKLVYSDEFKRLDKFYEDFEPFDPSMKIPQETISKCRFLFCRSKATFELKAIGYPSGIADAILSRVKRGACTQLSFIVKLHGRSPLSKLQKLLRSIINYALAEEGQVLFSYAQDNNVPLYQYAVTCIYSVNDYSEDDEKRQEIICKREQIPPHFDYNKYEGRIPAFFGPANLTPGGLTEQMEKWNQNPKK